MRSRAAHAAELVPEARAALAARSALEWEEIFGERVPCAAVRPIEDSAQRVALRISTVQVEIGVPQNGAVRRVVPQRRLASLSFTTLSTPRPFAPTATQ
jgi:hypothetical protein